MFRIDRQKTHLCGGGFTRDEFTCGDKHLFRRKSDIHALADCGKGGLKPRKTDRCHKNDISIVLLNGAEGSILP